jgi:hypothetical protein
MTDILAGAGSLEDAPTGSLADVGLPYAPAGSLAVLADLMGAGSVADATNSELGLLSGSLGVASGSLIGLLPVLALAGSVAGGVALAGGVQLPPIALPPSRTGSAAGSAGVRGW